MKGVKNSSLLIAFFFVLGISALLLSPAIASAADAASAELANADCAKCHAKPPADLEKDGGKHKGVGCTGCHVGHPPEVKDNIPKCSMCHGGKPHFELKGCLGCHKNPHTPLKISFGANVTEPCLTCHTEQIKQLREHKSKHSALGCSTCHNVHGKIPQCLQCHKPHAADMPTTECLKCHKPHMPTVVTYASDVPSKDCGACHKLVYDTLTASNAKHKTFACAFCHQAKHKMVPKCTDCHGVPHPAGIMAKFPQCEQCHYSPHDLNHWPEKGAEKKEAPAPKETKKKKKH
jgi:hypothetical protein